MTFVNYFHAKVAPKYGVGPIRVAITTAPVESGSIGVLLAGDYDQSTR